MGPNPACNPMKPIKLFFVRAPASSPASLRLPKPSLTAFVMVWLGSQVFVGSDASVCMVLARKKPVTHTGILAMVSCSP